MVAPIPSGILAVIFVTVFLLVVSPTRMTTTPNLSESMKITCDVGCNSEVYTQVSGPAD